MSTEDWTPEELELAADWGMANIEKAVTNLSMYYVYDNVYYAANGGEERPLTPVQSKALASFAATLDNNGDGPYLIKGANIVRRKDDDTLARIVVQQEMRRRKEAEKNES